MNDPFAVLGVDETASDEEVRLAWFTRVKEVRPERDPEGFRALRAAYDVLRTADGRARAALDRWPEDDDASSVDPTSVLLAFAPVLASCWDPIPEEPW